MRPTWWDTHVENFLAFAGPILFHNANTGLQRSALQPLLPLPGTIYFLLLCATFPPLQKSSVHLVE